jgi:hypothetical protein
VVHVSGFIHYWVERIAVATGRADARLAMGEDVATFSVTFACIFAREMSKTCRDICL